MKLEKQDFMCAITKRVIDDFNSMTNHAFMQKYSCSKKIYYKRVMKYGDPYMKAPLAKFGKFLLRIMK